MDTTLECLKALSNNAKMVLMDTIVCYPNTDSITEDIKRAENLGIVIPYSNLEEDLGKIERIIMKEPRYNQSYSRSLNIEVLRSLLLKKDLNYNSVDYIYFQRIKTPSLCLKNKNNEKETRRVSIFVDLNDARIQIHRIRSYRDQVHTWPSQHWSNSLPIAIAIIIAGVIISRSIAEK
jgi:hypothetical protein